jgi:hypothetical protein
MRGLAQMRLRGVEVARHGPADFRRQRQKSHHMANGHRNCEGLFWISRRGLRPRQGRRYAAAICFLGS